MYTFTCCTHKHALQSIYSNVQHTQATYTSPMCTHPPPPQIAQYDAAVACWHDFRHSLARACKRLNHPRDVFKAYWAAQQRFFKLLCVSLKTTAVVCAAQDALQQGHCVVVGLQSTGEAALDALGCVPGQECGWVSTLRSMMQQLVVQHFPVRYCHDKDAGECVCVGGCWWVGVGFLCVCVWRGYVSCVVGGVFVYTMQKAMQIHTHIYSVVSGQRWHCHSHIQHVCTHPHTTPAHTTRINTMHMHTSTLYTPPRYTQSH